MTDLRTSTTDALVTLAKTDASRRAEVSAELSRRVQQRKDAGKAPRKPTVKALSQVQAMIAGKPVPTTSPKAKNAEAVDAPKAQKTAEDYIALGQAKGIAFVQNMRKNARKPASIAALDAAMTFLTANPPKAAKRTRKPAKSATSPVHNIEDMTRDELIATLHAISARLGDAAPF